MAEHVREGGATPVANRASRGHADGEALPEDTAPSQRLLTVQQTATLLGCSPANVYALIDNGDLPYVAVGRSRGYRVDRCDVDEFIARRKMRKGSVNPSRPIPRPRLKHITF